MSLESKVMPSVTSMIRYIKSQVQNNLVDANNQKIITMNNKELEKLANIIDTSIDSAYIRSMSDITNILNNS